MTWNALGCLAFVLAGALASAILDAATGAVPEGPWMMIAGPLLAGFDVAYRKRAGLRLIGDVRRGPAILFLPAWVWGALWCGLGAWYYLRSSS